MKRLLALALLANSLSLPMLAHPSAGFAAEPISIRTGTAGELAEACATNPRAPGADAKINFCHGFAQGAISVELHNAGDKKPFLFPEPCPVARHDHGRIHQLGAGDAGSPIHAVNRRVVSVLNERYPCKS